MQIRDCCFRALLLWLLISVRRPAFIDPIGLFRVGESAEKECLAGCEVCASGVVIADSYADFMRPANHTFKGRALKELQASHGTNADLGCLHIACLLTFLSHRQGDFRSVMAIVTSCRSDLSPAGLSPHSHLADGRIRLVLVRKCSQLDYLRFLASIPKSGRRRICLLRSSHFQHCITTAHLSIAACCHPFRNFKPQ